jgi:subtilisin family serine protease
MLQFRKYIYFAVMIIVLGAMNSAYAEEIITDNLRQRVTFAKTDELIRINIRLEEQYQNDFLDEKHFRNPSERRKFVVAELKSFSYERQKELLTVLSAKEKDNKVSDIRTLWIINLVNCYANKETIEQISLLPGIACIDYDQEQQILDPDFPNKQTIIEADKLKSNSSIAWHVSHINAPEVWQLGYTGEDIIVGVLDSGVNYNHEDLVDNMWIHPDYPYHGYNFIENNNNPMDYFHHGTHVAGIVAGNGAAGTNTGIAPGTSIMAIKVLSNTGGGTQWGVWAGIQFGVENGAHILNLSLGWAHSLAPDRAAWRTAMVNTLNAGVIAAVAAGNEGSINNQPNNIRTPGDCPPPWKHPDQSPTGGSSAAVTVGSTMVSDIISGFSSRGPITWNNVAPYNDYPLNPGMGLIAPDVVAPGSNILSLSHTNNTGYFSQSGTSMAAPAVAGVMALLLSKNPGLSVVQISKILEETAVKLTATKSNTYGSGRLDALAALQATPDLGIHYFAHSVNDSLGNSDGHVNPGETVYISLELENMAALAYNDVVLHITCNSQYIILHDSIIAIGNFAAEEIRELKNVFAFQSLESMPGNNQIIFTISASSSELEDQEWVSSFYESTYGPFIDVLDIEVDDSEFGNNNLQIEPGELLTLLLPLMNSGQIRSNDINLSVNIDSPWVEVLSGCEFQAEPIQPNDTIIMELELGVFAHAEIGATFDVTFSIESGAHNFQWVKTLSIGEPSVFVNGAIPSTLHSNPNINSLASQPGQLTAVIPDGAVITGVDVFYDIISHNGGWISDQRSYLRCINEGGTSESAITAGNSISSVGRESYHRTGLEIANGVTSNEISFELHAFRLWGGTGSNTDYSYVVDSTWKILVKYQLPKGEQVFRIVNNLGETVSGAAIDIEDSTYYTDVNGEVTALVTRGCHLINVSDQKHKPIDSYFVHLQEGELTEIELERIFGVVFNLVDPIGNPISEFIITLNGESFEELEIYGLEDGDYSYLIIADGFARVGGEFAMNSQDVFIDIVMYPAYNAMFSIMGQFGNVLTDAVITIEDQQYEPGVYEFIELFPGEYNYTVEADTYYPESGTFEIVDNHVLLEIVLWANVIGVADTEDSVFKVYPNPAQTHVTVELGTRHSGIYLVSLVNQLGKIVQKADIKEVNGHLSTKISLESLSPGLYFIQIISGTSLYNHKLIVQ